jgi:thiamine-phosphate pyrophosphorylase
LRLPRVYPIIDTASLRARGADVLSFAAALLHGGAGIVQYRHKFFWDRETLDQLARLARLCQDRNVALVVNDRADLAALFQAGCHVGQDDLRPADARRIAGQGLLGFSTHDPAQLAAGDAEPVDYLAFGPVYPTASKQNPDPVVGLNALRQVRRSTRKPLVAIGGITRDTASAVLEAGADTIAVIGDLYPNELTPTSIQARMEEWLHRTN